MQSKKEKQLRYVVDGNITVVFDVNDNVFIIDTEDLAKVKLHKWRVQKDGYVKAQKYIDRKTTTMFLHRYIMNPVGGEIIDHRNRVPNDCRKLNLRKATHSQNQINQLKCKGSTSKYKGVVYDKTRDKWRANIAADNKQYFIGRFSTEEEAALAYNDKAKELHGEFAVLNIVKGDNK